MPNTKGPQSIDEIPCYECGGMHPNRCVGVSDVQRLVCRRILELEIKYSLPELYDGGKIRNRINELKELFNITDAMIEEERRRLR